MYNTILLILYIAVIIVSASFLVRFKEVPSLRRISAGLGVSGMVLAPYVAAVIYEVIVSIFTSLLLILIIVGGISMTIKSIFK